MKYILFGILSLVKLCLVTNFSFMATLVMADYMDQLKIRPEKGNFNYFSSLSWVLPVPKSGWLWPQNWPCEKQAVKIVGVDHLTASFDALDRFVRHDQIGWYDLYFDKIWFTSFDIFLGRRDQHFWDNCWGKDLQGCYDGWHHSSASLHKVVQVPSGEKYPSLQMKW